MCVPRVNLTSPDNSDQHIRFTRRQLPLRLAYCMTINKAQGQTFQSPSVIINARFPFWEFSIYHAGAATFSQGCIWRVGLWLPSPVFSHGQLYVALSRVGEATALRVAAAPLTDSDPMADGVQNIVWRELLL